MMTAPTPPVTLFCARCGRRFQTAIPRDLCRPCSRLDQADRILAAVAAYYQRTVPELLGRSRRQPVLEQRQVAMYLVRHLTQLDLREIGDVFGRGTTAVFDAERRLREPPAHLAADIARLTRQLQAVPR